MPVVYKKDWLPLVGYIVKWVHSQVTKGFGSYVQGVFGGWVVRVFLERFAGFLFSFTLLNVGKIRVFDMILIFLWFCVRFGGNLY